MGTEYERVSRKTAQTAREVLAASRATTKAGKQRALNRAGVANTKGRLNRTLGPKQTRTIAPLSPRQRAGRLQRLRNQAARANTRRQQFTRSDANQRPNA